MLIVFAGPACSGKSTLAVEVARRRNLPYFSMDEMRQRLMPEAAHTRADRMVAYNAMHMAAELLLKGGASVVLDAPYGHTADRAELARISNGKQKLIECRVSIETAVARLRARGIPDPTRPDLDEVRVAELSSEYSYTREGLLLDTDQLSFAECVARIDAFLG